MKKLVEWGISFITRMFNIVELGFSEQTRISFISTCEENSIIVTTKASSYCSSIAYLGMMCYIRNSFGSSSLNLIGFEDQTMEFKDFYMSFVLILLYGTTSDLLHMYSASVKNYSGFVVDLIGTRLLSGNEMKALVKILTYFQVDDSRFCDGDKPEDVKSSYHRPILFLYSRKDEKYEKEPSNEELEKQVEKLIENSNYDTDQYYVSFVYDANYTGKQLPQEQFYSGIEWLFRKSLK